MKNTIYILLGANLGDPILQIREACTLLALQLGKIIAISSIYESEAWGVTEQPLFYNQVLILETEMLPLACLACTQEIEVKLGRVRAEKWGARVIDIDILYFNNAIINTEVLTVPHPYIHLRNFTLLPLVEVASNYIHPLLNKTNEQLALNSEDKLGVRKTNSKHGI